MGDLLGVAVAVGVGLLGDPFVPLIRIGERMLCHLVEDRVALGGPDLALTNRSRRG